jgi:DNA (cytosine-5)-methyltransferase 1
MTAYYNEIDIYAAEWLRNLIKAGHIPDGEVDTRSIIDVAPDDLRAFTQCHFFAGIGGWGLALRLARWPDDRPIWTGSCPCQPFSVAGKGAGTNDPRHLWPHFHRLIAACRPPVVMGEQVAGAAGYGWLDGVRADLARENYASRGVDIPACAVDAPHIRQRLYWVASDMGNADHQRLEGWSSPQRDEQRSHGQIESCGFRSDMANTGCELWPKRCESRPAPENRGNRSEEDIHDQRRSDGDMANLHEGRQLEPVNAGERPEGMGSSQSSRDSGGDALANTSDDSPWPRLQQTEQAGGRPVDDRRHSPRGKGFWSDHIWLTGADGKSRRAKPGLPLLAHGIPNRVGRLRAYGNAIVPQVAAEVIAAFMECQP